MARFGAALQGGEKSDSSKALSPAERRRRAAAESAQATMDAPARRGESDEPDGAATPPAAAFEVASINTVPLPAEDAPVEEINVAVTKVLHAARVRFEKAEKAASDQLFLEAGPAARLAHKTGSWRHATDPDTGLPYSSFTKWGADQGVRKTHLYRMVKSGPLLEVLESCGVSQLKPKQVDRLSPVLSQHGAEEVVRAWKTAEAAGDTSPKGLATAIQVLELPIAAQGDDEPPAQAPRVLRLQREPGSFDPSLVRRMAEEQPEVARLVALTLVESLGGEEALFGR